jgi:hypothetical protein
LIRHALAWLTEKKARACRLAQRLQHFSLVKFCWKNAGANQK